VSQPPPRALPDNEEVEFGKLPEGSPFEAIQEAGKVKLRVRRSILLRTKVDIYRTAIVDESVCDIVQFTPREVSIIGRSLGQTHVTFWFDDPGMAPLTYVVEVKPDAEQVKADEDKYQLLENVINEMFPDSKIHLVIVADKLLVKGQAKDSEEAAQIMTIVRAQSGIRGGVGGVGGYGGYGGGLAEGAATPVLSLQATGGNPGPAYQIINMLRVPGVQQVALKVKIAELNRAPPAALASISTRRSASATASRARSCSCRRCSTPAKPAARRCSLRSAATTSASAFATCKSGA
jgi:Flp pilus assembly secretin CpaC